MSEAIEVRVAGGVLDRRRHICAFFNSKDEEYRTLLPFFKEGIDSGQRQVSVVDESYRGVHRQQLRAAGIEADEAERTGQLEIRSWEDAYLKGGQFDQHAMLVLVDNVLKESQARGYALTRLTANMEWALRDLPGVEDLVEYECTVNKVLAHYNDAVI